MTVSYQFRPLDTWTDPETTPRRPSTMFRAGWPDTLDLLAAELRYLDAEAPVIIQLAVTDTELRRDGMLRATARPRHPGVVVSFQSRYGPLRYACDTYQHTPGATLRDWQANVRAIALSLQALRAVDRYGATKRGEQYTGWTAIGTGTRTFATADEARAWLAKAWEASTSTPAGAVPWRMAYRRLAQLLHPDLGGSRDQWDRLQEAATILGIGNRPENTP